MSNVTPDGAATLNIFDIRDYKKRQVLQETLIGNCPSEILDILKDNFINVTEHLDEIYDLTMNSFLVMKLGIKSGEIQDYYISKLCSLYREALVDHMFFSSSGDVSTFKEERLRAEDSLRNLAHFLGFQEVKV